MERAYIAVGSNLGDRQANLDSARRRLTAEPGVLWESASPLYETPPVGPGTQAEYLNGVWCLGYARRPEVLLRALQGVETAMGRLPVHEREPWGPRVIDLDLLTLGDLRLDIPALTLPHPRAAQRWFVLRPWADLAPDFTPAGWSRTVAQALAEVEARGDAELGGLPGRAWTPDPAVAAAGAPS